MSQITPSSLVSNLEQDLAADWRHYHVAGHVKQFLALFVGSFAASLAAGGWHVAGWAAVGALALSAAGTAVRQMWPQVPWSVVKTDLAAAKAALEPAASSEKPAG